MTSIAAAFPMTAALIVGLGLSVAGCESARFGGRGPVVAARQAPARNVPDPSPVEAIPADPVISEPLPPLPSSSPAVTGTSPPASRLAATEVPILSGAPSAVETMTPRSPAPAPSASSRSGAVGAWMAREASGTACRVQLSSTPALDLYKASASGCTNKDLSRITAWDFRDGEVYLYQPGGAVAARLRSSSGALQGVLSKSGAPLELSRS